MTTGEPIAPPKAPPEPPEPPVIPYVGAPEGIYRERVARFSQERDRLTVRWERVGNVRLITFIGAAALTIWGLWSRSPIAIAAGLGVFGGFVLLVAQQNVLGASRRRYSELTRINEEAGKRLARAWNDLPLRQPVRDDPAHPYAADLDILGHGSLFHLLCSLRTPFGERTLARWLLGPAAPEVVADRQVAVAELVRMLDFRDEQAMFARGVAETRLDPEPFLSWAEGEPWLAERRSLIWISRISPLMLIGLFIAQVTGLIPFPLWLPFLGVNIAVAFMLGGRAYRTITRLWEQEAALRQYAALCELASGEEFTARALRRLQADLTTDGDPAHKQIRRVHRRTALSIPRSAALYWPIQLVTLWDVQVMAALERWQALNGDQVRTWLMAIGEFESLCALTSLAQDNPEWVFPQIDPAARTIAARDLGHPLIPPDARVDNDVEVGPPGSFLLVTGSNMSGKSTLLRAIGVNLVLAGAGAPVCAREMRAPPVELWTSMRVQDSLAEGVSYFMAELQRLKAVVDAGRRNAALGDRVFCYLLDEILQGTNTFERQIAARRIVAHLVATGAIGSVSTHDLTLADGGELEGLARTIHFTETFTNTATGPTMSFDYKIRPGLATSSNALRLMEIVGLDLSEGTPSRPTSS